MQPHFTTDQTERFLNYCAAEKIRVSTECKVLVNTLCRLAEPIDAVNLWLLLRSRRHRISVATVYRLLNFLRQTGFVSKEKKAYAEFALYRWNEEVSENSG